MKIIDLLIKISKNEKLPKKIKYNNKIWEYNGYQGDFKCNEENEVVYFFEKLFNFTRTAKFINDEIEIIEEDKKIEEIKPQYFDDERYTPEDRLNVCMNYINELTKEVNKLKGVKNDE
jgi:hypothetical protein